VSLTAFLYSGCIGLLYLFSSRLCVESSQFKCWSVVLCCRNCVQFCDEPGVNCKEGALLTQTVSYTVLTLDGYDIQPYQDLMQITAFGEDGRQLPRTRYRITENETGLCMSSVSEINVFCECVWVLQIQVFWDVTLCHWANTSWCFKALERLHLWGQVVFFCLWLLNSAGEGTLICSSIKNCSCNNTQFHPRRLETVGVLLWEPQISHIWAPTADMHQMVNCFIFSISTSEHLGCWLTFFSHCSDQAAGWVTGESGFNSC
jgi:hypothetical protein